MREKRRIAALQAADKLPATDDVDVHAIADDFEQKQREEQEKQGYQFRSGTVPTVLNVIVVLAALVVLLAGLLPPAPTFLIAATLALIINFTSQSEQADALKRHAPNALSMAGIIIAAAMFLGVLNETGMLEAIALSLINVLPEAAGPYLHVAVGMLGVPLDLLTSTDAYYFSVLPIVQETVAVYDISGLGAASALILGNVIGTFVSPFSPALWLALGLANAQMGRYLKLAFPIAWVFSMIIVGIAFATGLLA